jgi:putative aminopeptidase FrvX
MREESLTFLRRLLEAPGPSGYEAPAARVWREYAERHAAEVRTDINGNSIARLDAGATGPRVLIAGHIDQIGLLITHINGDGTLSFRGIGGWDDQILTGQRVQIITKDGPVYGVIGRIPAHALKGDVKGQAASIDSLFIDIGADDAATSAARVRPGDPAVVEQPILMLTEDRIVARGLDNRAGAFVAIETLRLLREGDAPHADVYAVATVAEEIGGFRGARTVTTAINPDIAFALDVTFATDRPGGDVQEFGEHRLGSGPAIARGGPTNPSLAELLIETAIRETVPYTIEALPRSTGTDADGISVAGSGSAVAVVSFPNRYMHSPNEVCSLADLEASARLLAATIRAITPATDFTPR